MDIVYDIMKVIICGGRDFDDLMLLAERMGHFTQRAFHVQVISGKAKGADSLGEIWARDFTDMPVLEFPADWDKHGRRAGWIRNNQMAEVATHVVAFWDGKSRGTKMMIDIARDKDLPLKIIRY